MQKQTRMMVLSAFFLALAFVLPYLTGQVPLFGKMLLPMHLPVLLCGYFCGGPWGALVGFIAPLARSLVLGMPPIFPEATSMAFELATYGFVSGLLYEKSQKQLKDIFLSLIAAMVAGRVVWGIVRVAITFMTPNTFTFTMFIAGALTKAIPGIILQLILVPVIVVAVNRAGRRTSQT